MTVPKPRHLGPDYAAQFQDTSVAAAYRYRPPYPDETFVILAELITPDAPHVLDLGCGTGDLARRLTSHAARVDAVDPSEAMLAIGRAQPGGDDPRLTWIAGAAETAPLAPPYGLVTAGESIHWMDWDIVFARVRDALAPGASLAIVTRSTAPMPWDAQLMALVRRYSTNREYRPYDLIAELTTRGLFMAVGERHTAAVSFRQPMDYYVESWHSRNGFSRQRMATPDERAFDAGVRKLLRAAGMVDMVELRVSATIVWGMPAG